MTERWTEIREKLHIEKLECIRTLNCRSYIRKDIEMERKITFTLVQKLICAVIFFVFVKPYFMVRGVFFMRRIPIVLPLFH